MELTTPKASEQVNTVLREVVTSSSSDTTKLIAAVGTVIVTILTANGGIEYSAAKRALGFHISIDELTAQNNEILKKLQVVTDNIAISTTHNEQLNAQIIEVQAERQKYQQQLLDILKQHAGGKCK